MYQTILVPLDGSKRAEAILSYVESLAHQYNTRVIFLRVIEPGPVLVDPHETRMAQYMEEIKGREEEATTYLAARRGEFRQKGIEAESRLMHGAPVEAIIQAAQREDADLIAMASHGRTGLGHVFYGSVAAGVLHQVDRPLLLIRSQAPG